MAQIKRDAIGTLVIVSLCTTVLMGCGLDGSSTPTQKTGGGHKFSAASASAGAKVIYGEDNRLDLYDVKEPARLALADGTVALMAASDLTLSTSPGGNSYNIRSTKFANAFELPLCPEERFRNEDVAAFCSGFLISPDKIATAGHCITSASDCANTKIVFGFSLYSANGTTSSVPASQVYSCKQIIHREQFDTAQDYAVIQLDRAVPDHRPLPLRPSGAPAMSDELMVIGHPSGLPTKVADGGVIRTINNNFLTASLDTYGGNSGSAVINTRTNEVEGILVRGENDFVIKNGDDCLISNHCSQDGCRGEDATRISFVLPYAK